VVCVLVPLGWWLGPLPLCWLGLFSRTPGTPAAPSWYPGVGGIGLCAHVSGGEWGYGLVFGVFSGCRSGGGYLSASVKGSTLVRVWACAPAVPPGGEGEAENLSLLRAEA